MFSFKSLRSSALFSVQLCVALGALGGVTLLSGQALALDPAAQAGLMPHKALYDIRMISKKSGIKVANITGQMVYQWQPSCDAWVSKHQFDMLYEYIEMPAVRLTSDYATYEAYDGSSFSFSSQRKNDQILFEEIRGNVESAAQGQPVSAVYSLPPNIRFSLPEGTLFPMAHTLDVIKHIDAGERFYKATLFDGSDAEGPVLVNSFIGKEKPYEMDANNKDKIDAHLITDAFYPLRLAFFTPNDSSGKADYEMTIHFHKNGVISALEIDYDDFSLRQDLVALEPTESLCAQTQKPIDGGR